MKFLLIEDDQHTADFICRGLREHGHLTDHAANGRDGLLLAASGKYDALVIDRMLPAMDGLTIVKTLQTADNHAPIIFLTTMDGIDDRVEGLEAGADDYLVKPFALSELLARLGAITRRPPVTKVRTLLSFADLEMNLVTREVRRGGRKIELQPQEFKLLEFLLQSDGRIVTKAMLLQKVWGFHFDPQTSVVETHMSRLRAKVDRDFDQALIRTLRGVGYCLRAEG